MPTNDPHDLLAKAQACRLLADDTRSKAVAQILLEIAMDYEAQARRAELMVDGEPHPNIITPRAE